MSRIINVRKSELKKIGYNSLKEWLDSSSDNIYIGRNMTYYIESAYESKWANPYSIKKYGRDKCLELYREYILNNQILLSELPELKNKNLGCWCFPDRCHGNILLELLDEKCI